MAFERIELNICPAGDMPVFHCSQYDTGRPIIIDLKNGDDNFTPSAGTTFELHCRKVDDNIVTLDTYKVDGNTLTFTSTEQLCACPGDNLCEVAIYIDELCMGTLNFMLHVEPDPLAGGLESETQIYNLTEQVEEITEQVIGDNYYNKTEVDDLLDTKADASTTYTKTEVDTALNLKADKSTTYTKTETDTLLGYKANASQVYTMSQTDLLLNDKADKSTTYTKTQVDDALALKANSADLATVATTGDYDDLLNKPTIPAAQVQSDYAQTDNTQVDYIKNKPDIDAMIAAALLEVMPVDTATAPIATFETNIVDLLQEVKCSINPVQDLHGYDHPWPAGGGNNLLKLNDGTYSINGVTIVIENGKITANGTATQGGGRFTKLSDNFILKPNTYYITGYVSASGLYPFINKASDNQLINTGDARAFIIEEETEVYFGINLTSSQTYANATATPMVNVGNASKPWEPYENVCPIEGYTEANIIRCGVNLWDEEWIVSSSRVQSKNFIPVAPETTFCKVSPNNIIPFYYDRNKEQIGTGVWGTGTFTTPANCYYIKFQVDPVYGETYNNDISINYPATDTTYHAYTGNTYTIAFGQTVYGGVLDVTRGKLSVTHQYKDLGSFTWVSETSAVSGLFKTSLTNCKWQSVMLCSAYKYTSVIEYNQMNDLEIALTNSEALPLLRCRNVAYDTYTATQFKNAVTGVQLVYELATPFDIDLTPVQISALVGTNNVFSDTNGDTTVKFKDSIQHYIDKKVGS